MARSSSFFGLRRGSTKSMTFQVLNGKQITKDRVSHVANPRTNAQMRTRVAFGTVAKAGASLAELVGISFQGITNINASRRRFNALNISYLTGALKNNEAVGAYAPKGLSVLIPNPYIVADGTIRNATLGTAQESNGQITMTSHSFRLTAGKTYTGEELIKIAFGCLPGDQITLVGISAGQPVEYKEQEYEILRDGVMTSARVVFKDAESIAAVTPLTIAAEPVAATVQAQLAAVIGNCIKEGYEDFVTCLSNADAYDTSVDTGTVNVILDWEGALAEPSLVPIIGDVTDMMAFGYFRSHLNEAGTQWMFSRCQLVAVAPQYTEGTYDDEDAVNYGYQYPVARGTYLVTNARENSRYTETGGDDNSLGF